MGTDRRVARPRRGPAATRTGRVALLLVAGVATLVAVTALWTGRELATLLASGAALVALGSLSWWLGRAPQLRRADELSIVREQALTDELTGIANRRALYLHLDALLELHDSTAAELDHGTLAVALVDLDHFKEVNDTYGHATGDALLVAVVERFSTALEKLGSSHLLARLGGDEFVVVLHEATSRTEALAVGETLRDSLRLPMTVASVTLHAHASIGLALAGPHGSTRGEVLSAADEAMYAAKTTRDAVRYHEPVPQERTHLTLAEDLHRALAGDELALDYEPVMVPSGRVVAVEARVRWEHPARGLLFSGDFLPAAERYHLSTLVTERVLDLALGDLARWRAAGTPVGLSVDLSAADLHDAGLLRLVGETLERHGVPAEALTLEVPETVLAAEPARTVPVLVGLHEMGVRLCVDHYGSGGLALAELVGLPVDALKLDARLVRDLGERPSAAGVVRATAQLAHALGLRLSAECVPDTRTAAALGELGCDLLQGPFRGSGDAAPVATLPRGARRFSAAPAASLPAPAWPVEPTALLAPQRAS